jgi:uracil-DNA glycosylase
MDVKIEPSWKQILLPEFEKEYFLKLTQFIREEYRAQQIFPPASKIFNAFELCPFQNTKVVILGQDPYHDINQAHGLCFSVNDGIKVPPSLVNIYKEIERDLGIKPLPSGNLERWAKQGVLLLNATLTVRAHQAASHQNKGFLLWGSYAIKKSAFIDQHKHLILTSPHPSPLSAHRGFLGNKHFSLTNKYLESKGLEPIKW